MTESELKEGDIVEIDYIQEFTNKHINEGKALILWKGFNGQPLILKLQGEYKPIWTSYGKIAKAVGHIDLNKILKERVEKESDNNANSD